MSIIVNVGDNQKQLVTFRLAGRLMGVDIIDVKEVCDNIVITPIMHSEEKICGFMNIRGQILLVVDLRTEFGFDNGVVQESSKVVVFKESVDEPFGILVDCIDDVITIDEDKITDRRASEVESAAVVDQAIMDKRKAQENICKGVYPLEKELVLLLNSRSILA